MAGVFKKPFDFDYSVQSEFDAFDEFFTTRNIPAKAPDEIDLATWNLANLGVQERTDKELRLIAHIVSKFDIIAIQEVRAELAVFLTIMDILEPLGYSALFSDVAGSMERLAVIYRAPLVLGPMVGELDYNPNGKIIGSEYVVKPKKQRFSLDGQAVETFFDNFNRNPYLTTWKVAGTGTRFMLANVHIYYGDKAKTTKPQSPKFRNRVSEIIFLSDWSHTLQSDKNRDKVYERNVILIGDMNVPKLEGGNPILDTLERKGFVRTTYSSESGTTIQDFTMYDQVVFANDSLTTTGINGYPATVVDYDNFMFRDLWQQVQRKEKRLSDFKAWTRYAISDHRPVFVRIKTA